MPSDAISSHEPPHRCQGGDGRWCRFATAADIIDVLRRTPEQYDPRSASVLRIGGSGRDPARDPFRRGFLGAFEERAELLRMVSALDERSRLLLVLWYVEGWPVTRVSRRLSLSRMHCYRLRNKALDLMLDVHHGRHGVHLVTAG